MSIRNVVNAYDSPGSSANFSANNMLNDRIVQKKIYIIETHINFLILASSKLEPKNSLLNGAVCEIKNVQMCIFIISESAEGQKIRKKLTFILN